MQSLKKPILILILILLLAACSKPEGEETLLMTCNVNVSNEDEHKMQDYYGVDDSLSRLVQKTETKADNKQELNALKDNRQQVKEKYDQIPGVNYTFKTKKNTLIEKLEIILEEVELATLIDFEILPEGTSKKDISVSKTKEILEERKLAKCKLID